MIFTSNKDTNGGMLFWPIAMIYALANGIILFNQGVFWDDWTLYNMSFNGLQDQFNNNGSPHLAYLHYGINQLSYPILFYRIATLFSWIGALFFIWKTIFSLLKVKSELLYAALLICAALPFFGVRNTMICLPYSICVFFFSAATYYGFSSIVKPNILKRLLSIILFFASFTTNSLIVFYVLPFLLFYLYKTDLLLKLKAIKELFNRKNISIKNLLSLSDFILVPFVFAIVKSIYLMPSGLFLHVFSYNEITLKSVMLIPLKMIAFVRNSIVGLSHEWALYPSSNSFSFILCILLFVILYKILKKNNGVHPRLIKKEFIVVMVLSLAIIILAMLPYALVDRVGKFSSFSSRHQLLLPFGSALLIGSILGIIFPNRKRFLVGLSLVLTFSVVASIGQNVQYMKSWIKQDALKLALKEDSNLENKKTVITYNDAKDMDATIEGVNFYVYNGIAKEVLNSETRLICEYDLIDKIGEMTQSQYFKGECYNMQDYKLGEIDLILSIKKGKKDLSNFKTLRLVLKRYTNKKEYQNEIKTLLKVQTFQPNESVSAFLNL